MTKINEYGMQGRGQIIFTPYWQTHGRIHTQVQHDFEKLAQLHIRIDTFDINAKVLLRLIRDVIYMKNIPIQVRNS